MPTKPASDPPGSAILTPAEQAAIGEASVLADMLLDMLGPEHFVCLLMTAIEAARDNEYAVMSSAELTRHVAAGILGELRRRDSVGDYIEDFLNHWMTDGELKQ